MKSFIYNLLLSVMLFLPLHAAETKTMKDLLGPLHAIRDDAIEIGSGPVDVYVFIDPNCPHSRDFLEMISQSRKMQRRYHYYFFLYSLPLFKSSAVVNAIYSAPSPKKTMLSYMLKHEHITTLSRLTPPAVQAKVVRIRNAAERIGVDKRPYLILDKKKQP